MPDQGEGLRYSDASAGMTTLSSRHELDSIILGLADPAMLIATDRRILLANDPASELFGWEDTGLAGQSLDVLLPESVAVAHRGWSDDFFNKPTNRIMGDNPRLEGVRKNGERIRLDISLSPVKVDDENLVLVCIRNIGAIISRHSIPLNDLTALSEIARLVTGPMEATEVYRRMARQIRSLLPYDQLLVYALDRNNPVLRNLCVAGQEVAAHQLGAVTALSGNQLTDLLSMTKPVAFTNGAKPGWFAGMVESLDSTSDGLDYLLSVPLRWNDEVIGTLNLRSRNDLAFEEESLKLAEQIASSVASVVAKSRFKIIEAEAIDQRTIMANVGRLVGNTADIRLIIDSLATQIDQLIPIDRLTLTRVDIDRERFVVEAEWGSSGPESMHGVGKDLSASGTEIAVLAGVPVIFTSEQIEAASLNESPAGSAPVQMKSWLTAPLKLGGRVIGVIHFRYEHADVYQPIHLDLAQDIATQISGVFGDSSAIHEHERERKIRNSVISLTRGLVRGDRLEAMAEAVKDHLSHFVEFDRFSVVAIDQDREESMIIYESGVALAGFGNGETFLYTGMASAVEPKIGTKAEDSAMWGGELTDAGLNSWMYTAISGRSGLPVGSVRVRARRQRAFDERDLETLERLTSVMVPEFHGFAQEIARQHLAEERERTDDLSHQTEVLDFEAKAKSEFVGSITHEFKTPLTSIVAFSNLLSHDSNLTERQVKQVSLIQSNAVRLEQMINDLLDIAQANAGKLSYNISAVQVSKIVRESCESLRQVAKNSGRRLFYNCPETTVTACVDSIRLAQALQNLISNAIKYSPDRTGITVSVEETDKQYMILVRNRGTLTAEQLRDAFIRFNRLGDEMTKGQAGNGLGLPISRQILEDMGGSLELESHNGFVEARLRVPLLDR